MKLAVGYALGGWELLAVVRALLVGLFTGLLVLVAPARGASSRTAAILALAAFALAAPALGLLSFAPSALAAEVARMVEPGDRVVVPQIWASWFEWAAAEARYLVDSRFELFPPEVWADEVALRRGGDDVAEVLERWAVDIAVVPTGWSAPGADWLPLRSDQAGLVLVRRERSDR